MSEITETSTCANCAKNDDTNQMMTCSACKTATYCSKSCQKAHWKVHKPRCLLLRSAKQDAQEQHHKRELRLLQNWKDLVRNGILPYVLICTFGLDSLRSLHRKNEAILLTVDFDYNKRNFMPTKMPSIVPIDTLDRYSEPIKESYKEIGRKFTSPNDAIIVVMLSCQTTASIMPLRIEAPPSPPAKQQWEALLLLFNEVKLSSTKFASWMPMLDENVKKQLNAIQTHEQFQPFLVNALRIESNESRHKSHVVVVNMEMGFGLGEIKRLKNFEVWPVSKVISELSNMEDPVPAQQLQYYKTNLLDMESSPILLKSRILRPNNALLPVVFVGKSVIIYIMPNLMEIFDDHDCNPVKKCDKKARLAFVQLQGVPLPSMQSPPLH